MLGIVNVEEMWFLNNKKKAALIKMLCFQGHVTSYYGLHLEKHASFQAHPHGDDIRQLICHDMGILSLSKNQLRLTERRGVKVFEYS